ncbi:MAG: hypothetical protein HXL63_07935, partial [Thermobifida sp.]|nr:hypothetical protein [Thermobifida sp.]
MILRDGCPAWEVDEGIIVEAYKSVLGNPKFAWPDFYDRMVTDHNENVQMTMRGAADWTMILMREDPELLIPSRTEMQGYVNAVTLEVVAELPKMIDEAVAKALKEKK